MLSRDQIMTLLLIRKRQGTVLFNTRTPKTIINLIGNIAYDPNSDIAKLLHAIAHDSDPITVKKMLDENPRLLLEVGDVVDSAGNTIRRVTPYQCALGAGNDKIADIIRESFTNIKEIDGEKERLKQYAHYQNAITEMDPLKQNPDFDFAPLLKQLIESSSQDVSEELKTDNKFNANYKSLLRNELEAFRRHFAPKEIKGGMHFNYANLQKAFELYSEQFNTLKKTSNNNWDKLNLFWRQVIGFIQRRLPDCDRKALAQGIIYYIKEENGNLTLMYNYSFRSNSFPITSVDSSRTGMGYECDITGAAQHEICSKDESFFFKTYVEQKHQTCKTHEATPIKEPRFGV